MISFIRWEFFEILAKAMFVENDFSLKNKPAKTAAVKKILLEHKNLLIRNLQILVPCKTC